MTFWKKKQTNYGDNKKSVITRGGGDGGDEQAKQDFQGSKNILYDTIIMGM